MQVGHQEEALVLVLEPDAVGERAGIVAEMQLTGRPIAGENTGLFLCGHIDVLQFDCRLEIRD
jgi:hypothetical protein